MLEATSFSTSLYSKTQYYFQKILSWWRIWKISFYLRNRIKLNPGLFLIGLNCTNFVFYCLISWNVSFLLIKKNTFNPFLDQKNYPRKSLIKLRRTCLRVLATLSVKKIWKYLDVEKEVKLKLGQCNLRFSVKCLSIKLKKNFPTFF